LATSSDALVDTSTSPFTIGTNGQITTGLASMTVAPLVVRGSSGGADLIQLQRTVGGTLTYGWSLAGGCLAFADQTAGFLTANFCGDGGSNDLYIGGRGRTAVDSRISILSGKTLGAGAGTDQTSNEFRILGGAGTGAGNAPDITFYTANVGSSGTTPQTTSFRMTIKGNTGNVGIGTTTPAGLLQVASTLPQVYITDTNSAVNIKHSVLQNSNGIFSINPATDALGVSTTPALAINLANGRVGIGTNPSSDFHLLRTSNQAEAVVETITSGLASFSFRGYSSGTTHFTPSQGSAILELRDKTGTNNGFASIIAQDDGGSNLSGLAFVFDDPTNNIGSIKFNTRASGAGFSTKMTLTSNGDLAIGTTTSDTAALSIREITTPDIFLASSGDDSSGMYITDIDEGSNTNEGVISAGAQPAYSGGAITSWTARSTSASGYYFDNGDTQIFGNSGLTSGSTFTPTVRLSVGVNGRVGIATTTPESTLSVGSVGDSTSSYMQIDNVAGAPTANDCDSDMERGRQILDSTNHRLYVCNGATRGWDYLTLTD